MISFYLDTSAIVKRYKTETGTDFIDKLFETIKKHGEKIITSFLSILEFISAGRRLLKTKEITSKEFENLLARFLKDVEEFFALRSVEDRIVARAVESVISYALKPADAIQLVCVIETKEILERMKGRVVFIADDEELCNAGLKEGLEVINPREKQALKKLEKLTHL